VLSSSRPWSNISPWVYADVSCGQLLTARATSFGVAKSKGTAGGVASALEPDCIMSGRMAGRPLVDVSLASFRQATRTSNESRSAKRAAWRSVVMPGTQPMLSDASISSALAWGARRCGARRSELRLLTKGERRSALRTTVVAGALALIVFAGE